MSGNGEFIPNRSDFISQLNLPPVPVINFALSIGTGGGCVTTGPFANITVPFGPVNYSLFPSLLNNPENLAYKPHCLRRDLNPKLTGLWLTSASVESLLKSPNITVFNRVILQGSGPGGLGVHGAGHRSVGMDMIDFFSSPGDPIFFLHHTQIDRLWTLWQKHDPAERQYAISGTGTLLNYPPSPEFQLNDTIDLGKLSPGGPQPIRDFLNTLGGPFCYEYE
ncbi:hypothetical protein MMC29_001445 [Sticta canariensis]|nr:hypothetical protein [Sticta canariensis]